MRTVLFGLLVFTLGCAASPPGASDAMDGTVDVPSDTGVVAEIIVPAGPYGGFVPSGPYVGEMLGVSTHMSRHAEYSWKREAELDRLEELGFTRVRSDFYWKEVEPVDGGYDVSGPAHMTDLCLERGFSVLGILLNPPSWAMPDGSTSSADPERFRAYVQYTVGEMLDRIHHWEIWNEQNLDVFWGPSPNPGLFGTFLKIAAEEIRALDPDAEITFGGLSPFQFHPGGIWAFLLDVAELHPDICQHFDSLAIHPYSFAQQHSPEDEFVQGRYVHPPLAGLIGEARFVLEQIGCPDVPIHLTEAGWPDYYMGVEKQGAYAARGLLLAVAAGAASYYWYTFWDSTIGPDEVAPTECTFGLMTVPASAEEPGERKPSFHAMLGASSMLGGTRYAGDLGLRLAWDAQLHALAFVDDAGRFTLAFWHSEDDLDAEIAVEVPAPEGATGWERYDQSGALQEEGAVSPVPVTATGRVSYLRFE